MITENREKFPLLLDEGFSDRVFKTSLFLSLLLIVCSLSFMSFPVTVSIIIGCFISLVLSKTLWWTIQYVMQNKRDRIKVVFLKVSIVKYFIVGAILLAACLFLEVNIAALTLGLGIVVAVIIMKISSRLLVNYMNKSNKAPLKDVNSFLMNKHMKGV